MQQPLMLRNLALGVAAAAGCAAWLALSPAPAAPPLEAAPASLPRSAATLSREPFLQKVSDTSVTVVWATREPGAGELRYHVEGSPTVLNAAANTTLYAASYTGMSFDYYQHEATASGLTPSTTYRYDVSVDGVVLTPGTDLFTTAPANGQGTVTFIAFGDSGSGEPRQLDLGDLMAAQSAAGEFDLAIHTGDVVYPKGTHQLLNDRFFRAYEGWLRRRPIFMSFGNHEEYAFGGQPYFDVFALPENGANDVHPDHRERYYSFDYGPVHFIALDTQLALSSGSRRQQQLDWLVRDLEATTQPWRIAFFHRPAYGSNDFTSSFDVRDPLRPIFERYGVQLVLAGHEHAYTRGIPWREGSGPGSPVMHVLTGGGGASLNKPQPGPWAAAVAAVYHYLRVTVSDCTASSSCALTLEAIGLDGRPFDTFTLPLRDQSADTAAPEIDWDGPADGSEVSGRVALTATATDDTRITKADLRIDGELRAVDDAAPFEWSWDTTKEMNGARTLELRAVDLAGNLTSSQVRTLHVRNTPPSVRLLSPLSGDRAYTGLAYHVRWAAGDGASPLQRFDASVSVDGGRTFTALPGCSAMPASARECVWTAPGPVTKKAVVRVSVADSAGRIVTDTSPAFAVRSGTTTLALKRPDKTVAMGTGSRQSIFWSSAMGTGATVDVDLSRDGGASWTTLAPSLLNRTQSLRWMVTGPETAGALVRVRALNVPLQDVSTALSTIVAPRINMTLPTASTVWLAGTAVQVKWKATLGEFDRVNVRLSTDGGATYPVLLAASVPATQPAVKLVAPAAPTTRARILVEPLDSAVPPVASGVFTIR